VETRDRILNAVRRDRLTVADICSRLKITRTAVNSHLQQLLASGLIQAVETRRSPGAGKPAVVYRSAEGSEDANSCAYRPFLLSLLSVLHERFDERAMGELLEETGRRLARSAGFRKPGDAQADLRAAMASADSLGASTELSSLEGGLLVRNFSCPLGAAVRLDDGVCRALTAFFSEATGKPAQTRCLRDGRLLCQYLIELNGTMRQGDRRH
jgi:predicted ArsR family transcriptional regulator